MYTDMAVLYILQEVIFIIIISILEQVDSIRLDSEKHNESVNCLKY